MVMNRTVADAILVIFLTTAAAFSGETLLRRSDFTPARLTTFGTFIRASIDATLAGKAPAPPV